MSKLCVLILVLNFFLSRLISQDRVSVQNEFIKVDLYNLWIFDSTDCRVDIIRKDGKDVIIYGKWKHWGQPLGFIGDNYQRLYIHFDSIKQNKIKPLEYFVFGKSKVEQNICSFQGKMIITEAYKNRTSKHYDNDFITGVIKGDFEFYENKEQKSSGVFKGSFYSNWCKNLKTNVVQYDALNAVADGFCNNGFTGEWISYRTNAIKKCSWGDYRIPECGDLDIGVGDFYVNTKYLKFGWENYSKAYSDNPYFQESRKARSIEDAKWWILDKKE